MDITYLAKEGDYDKLKEVLEGDVYVVDINIQDENGFTALMWSSFYNDIGTVKYLLNKGAKVDIRDKDGNTALTWASHEDVVELLEMGCGY